ncbi:unnamed protein product [Orchesella dallaii]|uniref:Uncharacterized protein n=1 Tax=Orchesella dallaii TaxID=48710 RepID=A0ABP1RUH2_9HEXA
MILTCFKIIVVFALQRFSFTFAVINRQLWELTNETVIHEIKQGRQLSSYRNINQPKAISRTLPSLNNQINLFGPNCLTHIINYNGMDIPAPNKPIVLSRYDVIKPQYLILEPSMHRPKVQQRVRLFLYNHLSTILQNKSVNFPWCDLKWPDMQCEDIPLVFNTMRIKPWLCESHFHLFPPAFQDNPTFYQWDSYSKRLEFIFPGNWKKFWFHTIREAARGNAKVMDITTSFLVHRPWFDIMVSEGKPDAFTLYPWAYALSNVEGHPAGFYTTTARELFVISTVPNPTQGILNFHSTDKVLEFESIYILCRHCFRCKTLVPVKLNISTPKLLDAEIQVVNENTDNIIWKMWLMGGWNVVYLQKGSWPTENEHQTLSATPSLGEMRWRVESIIFRNILGNSTIHSDISGEFCRPEDRDKDCGCDDKYPAYPLLFIVPAGRNDHMVYRIHHNILKFVSCGKPLETSLPFSQLFSIFDKEVWIGILIVIFLIVPFVLRVIRAHGDKSRFLPGISEISALFIICIKPLLEQGNPIPTAWEKSLHTQLVMGLLMLATLVISNAYRNENITQITLPRQPIPYDKFDLLVRDNFTILTRGSTLGGFVNLKHIARKNEWEPKVQFQNLLYAMLASNFEKRSHDMSFAMKSEIFVYAMLVDSSTVSDPTMGEESIENARVIEIMNHTKLIPDWLILMADNNMTNFYNIMKGCNKTALFLPDMEAHELYYEMRRQKHKYAYLSDKEDKLLDFKFGIWLGKWVNRKILARFYGMQMSGIWEWWNGLIVNFMTRVKSGDRTSNEFTASNLEGNISIVFVTLVAGLGASILGFVIECNKYMREGLSGICRFSLRVVNACKKYVRTGSNGTLKRKLVSCKLRVKRLLV